MRDPALEELLSRRGAVKRIAEACNISTAAVSQWRRVPKVRIGQVAEALGVQPENVRPDLYGRDAENATHEDVSNSQQATNDGGV